MSGSSFRRSAAARRSLISRTALLATMNRNRNVRTPPTLHSAWISSSDVVCIGVSSLSRLGAGALQDLAHPADQLQRVERFHDVVLGAQVQPLDDLLLAVLHRHDDDRNARGALLTLELGQDVEAVLEGHDQVEEHQVGM